MEICKRCEGTGHNGGCDVCGGSGFIDPLAHRSEDALKNQSHAAVIAEYRRKVESRPAPRVSPPRSPRIPKPQPRRVHPAAMGPEDRICGLAREQLEIPEGVAGIKISKITTQIEHIVSAMSNVTKIVWRHSPYECTAYDEAGNKTLFTFALPKTPNQRRTKKVAVISPPVVREKGLSKPINRARTIPHPSQVAPGLPDGSLKKRRAPVGKGVLVRVVKAEPSQKASQSPNRNPNRPQHGKMKSKFDNRPERPRKEKVRNEGPTAFELAFAAAKAAEIDGSKDWAGYRDVTTGRFGSYPSFDPSETPDD